MKLSDQLRAAYLSADRSRRAAVARALGSPLLRWRYGSAAIDTLLIVPQDLRPADQSFWREIEMGQFGLAGTAVVLDGKSPFEIKPPNAAWDRALNGFSWLGHLAAIDVPEAREAARDLAVEWTIRQRALAGPAWEPDVAGRRLISWISHAGLLLEGTDAKTYETLTHSLGQQLVRLSATWGDGSDGYPRLLALTALVLADLAIAGHDRQLPEAEAHLTAELKRQILSDGGHVSRNPAVLVELLLDFLPLRQCFHSRSRPPPPALLDSISRMLVMLRHMRLGDGMLARFNGMSVPEPAGLATVLAYDDHLSVPPRIASASHYARLERLGNVLIADAGGPPPVRFAGEAHAGALSFEFSAGARPIMVNAGAPAPQHAEWRSQARATANHNTLCLAETASASLVENRTLADVLGSRPIRMPGRVSAEFHDASGDLVLTMSHEGYKERFGLVHTRTLTLAQSGRRLLGRDRLDGGKRNLRLRQDLPFSIHFHLRPGIKASPVPEEGHVRLTIGGGETWRLTVEGALISVEASDYFADSVGPVERLQIVARGSTFGETEVRWVLERVG